MQDITIDTKVLLGLIVGTQEERIAFFANADIVKKFDIVTIKVIFFELVNKAEKNNNYDEIIMMLQSLMYNRHKSPYKEEIADFVADTLFEYLAEVGVEL